MHIYNKCANPDINNRTWGPRREEFGKFDLLN